MLKTDGLLYSIGEIRDDMILDAKSDSERAGRRLAPKVIAVLAAVVILFAAPVLAAADIGPAYEILYKFSPVVAQSMKPVQIACEDNGIRMEVVATDIVDDTAKIYISMQDLTGDRIDATTDLFDSYRINRSFDCSASCRRVSYDPETKTVTFLITLTQWGEKEISGRKLTFSVSQFLSNKTVVEGLLPDVDLSSANPAPRTTSIRELLRGYSEAADHPLPEKFLMTSTDAFYVPVNGIQFTAMGLVEDRLHIQLYCEDILNTDNHCALTLVDRDGETLTGSSISYWDGEQCGVFYEYVFDVGADALSNYQLHGSIVTSDTLTQGNWQVTFPLD